MDDSEALAVLGDRYYEPEPFLLTPRQGVVPTEMDLKALAFMVYEWDWAYDLSKVEWPSEDHKWPSDFI